MSGSCAQMGPWPAERSARGAWTPSTHSEAQLLRERCTRQKDLFQFFFQSTDHPPIKFPEGQPQPMYSKACCQAASRFIHAAAPSKTSSMKWKFQDTRGAATGDLRFDAKTKAVLRPATRQTEPGHTGKDPGSGGFSLALV